MRSVETWTQRRIPRPGRSERAAGKRQAGWKAPMVLVALAMAFAPAGPITATADGAAGGRVLLRSPAVFPIIRHVSVATSALRPTEDPTNLSIPPVVDAVRAARRGAPIPQPLIPPLQDIHYDESPPIPDCWGLRDKPHHLAKCTLFPDGHTGTIVLIGDSHARQWLTPIMWVAKRDDWKVVPLWHNGCYPSAYDAGRECSTFFRWAQRQVRILQPDVVLLGGALRYATPRAIRQSTSGIAKLVAGVTPHATHVALIGDPPDLRFQPYLCLGRDDANLGTCTAKLTADQIKVYLAAEHAAKSNGAAFVNAIRWFCFRDECPAVVGHTVTYRVRDHITMHYGSRLRYRFHRAFLQAVSPSGARTNRPSGRGCRSPRLSPTPNMSS